ncbi:hypothetical protein M422DRAFT_197830 [Sphaerobolus stellatus SS14]|nr:hypothetical protein M422DRAFT_197830 [Sphaerobolus stellatus SS14]
MRLPVLLATLGLVAAAELNVYHRIWNPAQSPPPFVLRGTLNTSPDAVSFSAAGALDQLIANSDHLDDALYQIALQRNGDASESEWDLSSVKACHLRAFDSDILRLHLSSSGDPYAIDYFLSPVPHDGSCPKTRSSSLKPFANTTLLVQSAQPAPLPQLRTPPPISPTGEAIQPPREKSFLEKYGIYIGVAVVILMFAGGAPEEGQGGGRAASR